MSRRFLVGMGLSIGVHAVLVFALPKRAPVVAPSRPIQVEIIRTERLSEPERKTAEAEPAEAEAPNTNKTEPRRTTPPRKSSPKTAAIEPSASEPASTSASESSGARSGEGAVSVKPGESAVAQSPGGRGGLLRGDDPLLPKVAVPSRGQVLLPQAPATKHSELDDIPALHRNGEGGYALNDIGFDATIDHDGTLHFKDKSTTTFFPKPDDGSKRTALDGVKDTARIGASIVGLDITDLIMRAVGEDPYWSDKVKILSKTRTLRNELCDADRKEVLAETLGGLKQALAAVWRDGASSPAARRRILFQLWDECSEPGSDGAGDAEVRGGLMARATILAFIRDELPEGSESAYSKEELLALNERRKSKEAFAPYTQ